MASFSAFIEVKGERYPLLGYELSIYQETDSLGRPASPTLGGTIDCLMSAPGSDQPFLLQWMFSPTMQEDGKLVLLQDSPRATLKTISFFNAYCTGLQTNFVPGDTGGGSLQMQVRISPQRIAVGAIIHDNNWPLVSHGAGETFAEIPVTPIAKGKSKADEEPGLFSDIAHTVLDVAGLVPVIGELADGANALYYLAEGNKTDAALSAAAMIPIAGVAATGGKLIRKGLKIATKAKAVKKASDKVTKGAKAVKVAAKRKVKKVTRLPEHVVEPPFKQSKKHDPAEFEGQLKGQEDGLNDLTVDNYLANRDKYLKNGRAPEGDLAQKQAREKAIRDKQAELRRTGKSKEEAKTEAENWIKSQNALHNPDQIAGGHPEKIQGMGEAGVNKSIGSQWDKHKRADKLDEYVRKSSEGMTPTQRKKTKLNVKLPKTKR